MQKVKVPHWVPHTGFRGVRVSEREPCSNILHYTIIHIQRILEGTALEKCFTKKVKGHRSQSHQKAVNDAAELQKWCIDFP